MDSGAESGDIESGTDGASKAPPPVPPIEFVDGDAIVGPESLAEGAAELADLVRRATGIVLTVETSPPPNSRFISLSLGCDLPQDAFSLASPDEREIAICAAKETGIYHGIVDFAERHLGVR